MSRRPLSPPTSAQPEPVSPGGRGVHPAARRGTAIFKLAAPPFPSSMQSAKAPQITVISRRRRDQPGACCLSAAGCCVDAAASFQPLPSRKEAGVTLIGGGHDRCCWEEKQTDFITASARLEVGVKPVMSHIHLKKIYIYILDILVSGLSMFYTVKGFSGSFCSFSILKFYLTDFLYVLFSTLVQ